MFVSVMIVAGLLLIRTTSIAFFFQRLASLRAGIVEFRRLSDDDRAGADDEDFFEFYYFSAYCSSPFTDRRQLRLTRLLRVSSACARGSSP